MNKNLLFSLPEFEEAKSYWLEKLSGELAPVKLPADFGEAVGYQPGSWKFKFSGETAENLNRISKNQEIALYTILTAALNVLIYKYTGQSDIIIGAPLFTETDSIYEYNHSIVFRNFIKNNMTFKEFLLEVKGSITEGYLHQHYPFEKLAGLLELEAGMPLFGVAAILENIHRSDSLDKIIASFGNDLAFSFLHTGAALEGRILYNAGLFREESVQRLQACYLHILSQVLSNLNLKIRDIELIPREEKDRIAKFFNPSSPGLPGEKTLPGMFQEQVEKTPDRVAVCCVLNTGEHAGCNTLTYRELNEKANRLAGRLREKGVKPGSIAGLMLEYSVDMLIGILGILKAGGAYLPIDPEYPPDRIRFLLDDSGAGLLLTESNLAGRIGFSARGGEIIDIHDKAILKMEASNPEEINNPEDPAYVIYTSGSTGKPKGVLIEHRSIVNFARWRIEKYRYSPADVTLQLLSVSFDGFGTNLYSSLLSGGSLVIVGGDNWRNFDFLRSVIRDRQVTNMSVVPSIYKAILEGGSSEDFKTLRFVVIAGEEADESLIDRSELLNPQATLINEYGPTENTITTTSFAGISRDHTSIIGQPVSNHRVYILNGDCNLMPIGVPGELCVSGAGLARGYLNRPELTAEKFIPNPFQEFPVPSAEFRVNNQNQQCDEDFQNDSQLATGNSQRRNHQLMYKTGDLARWLPDGNIEFLGRVDHQVKIRGYRVELGEIENRLLNYEPVKEAVAIVREDKSGNKSIYAYIVAERELTVPELREHLSKKLPDYMIPSYFVHLDHIPLTPHGKIDRKALIQQKANLSAGVEYVAPRNPQEEKLAEIWRRVLDINRVGINDPFFEIGGDSLKAVSVSMECANQGMKISTADIFRYKTISEVLRRVDDVESEIIKPGNAGSGDGISYSVSGTEANKISGVKKLNVKLQRDITTYLHRALPLCAILAHDGVDPWYYQHYIQIFSITYKNGFSRLEFLEPKNSYAQIFDEVYLPYQKFKDGPALIGYITNMIDSGYYLTIYIDEYYLPETPRYKKTHFIHPILIYGYDNPGKKFLLIGFDRDGIFNEMLLDYDIFAAAYQGGKRYYKKTAPWAKTEAIQLLKPKDLESVYRFDLHTFLEELNSYLLSSGIHGARIDSLISRKELKGAHAIKYGFAVYDVVLECLEKLSPKLLTIDYRSIHLLYEHKKLLYNRLKYIMNGNHKTGPLAGLLEEFLQLAERLNSARLKSFDLGHMLGMVSDPRKLDLQEIRGRVGQIKAIIESVRNEERALLGKIYEGLKESKYSIP